MAMLYVPTFNPRCDAPMTQRRFTQVDVFTRHVLFGNPLAVVHDAQGMSDARMQAFARWMNLSETTFLLPPDDARADYRVRIFTPGRELPFAGHPTLGSAWAWLNAGGRTRHPGVVIQQCDVGRVTVKRHDDASLAFQAPTLTVEDVGDVALQQACDALGIEAAAVRRAAWLNNGPRFLVLQLSGAAEVLALRPRHDALKAHALPVGVVGMHAAGSAEHLEVRAFLAAQDAVEEDPVTGSMQASIAGWLMPLGEVPTRYVAAQGTAIGRAGRVSIERDAQGVLWVGGHVTPCIEGTVSLAA